MAADDTAPPRSVSGSPPIEVISVSADDDDDAFDDEGPVDMLDDSGGYLTYDPTVRFPFHDEAEPYAVTIERLLQYLPTHDQVSRAFVDWICNYLSYARTASFYAVKDSYYSYREVWRHVPQLPLYMVTRK
jgi:ubiquitin carboxyl-terminal hydrolase 34